MNINLKDYSFQKVATGEVICYRQYGESKEDVIILLHGNHTSQGYWDISIQDFVKTLHFNEQAISKPQIDKTSIISIDIRGFGRSSYNQFTEKLEDLAQDIIELIIVKGFKNIKLIGWSMGGLISMVIAARIPENVSKIMLVAAPSYYGYPFTKYDDKLKKEVKRDTEEFRNRLKHSFTQIFQAPTQQIRMKKIKQVLSTILYKTESEQHIQDLQDYFCEETLMQRNYIETNIGIHNFDFFLNNPNLKIQCPVFIYHGQLDPVIPFSNALKNVDFIGSSLCKRVLVREGCGHCPFLQHHSDFTSLSLDFFYNNQQNLNQDIQAKL